MRADREIRAERMSEWLRMVRASWVFGSADDSDSQDDTLLKASVPSADTGLSSRSEDKDAATSARERFSSSL